MSGDDKLSDFNNSFAGQCYDIVSVTETWLHDGVNDEEILPGCNYDIYRRDRNSETSVKRTGGGVMLAVTKDISSLRRRDLETCAELLWVEVRLDKSRKAYIGTFYLPIQNDVVLQAVEASFSRVNSIVNSCDTVIALGDFNMSMISWSKSPHYQYALCNNRTDICRISDQFLEILDANGLHQYNTLPTTELLRDRSSVNNHVLDLVIANKLDSVCIDRVDNATTSTHKALEITAKLNVKHNTAKSERVAYNYKRVDWDHILRLLACIYWTNWSCFYSTDDAFNHFYDIVYAVIEDSIPTYKVKNGKFPSWYSKELIALVKHKVHFRRQFLSNGRIKTSNSYISFCRLRKEVKRLQKRDHSDHIKKVECSIKQDPKKFWSHVKSLKSTNSIPNSMTFNNITYTTSRTILKAFSLFFKSVFIQYDSSYMPHCEYRFTPNFVMPRIKASDVRNILRSLEPSTSTGCDNISATFLIKCADSLCYPLADLFNISIQRGEYPDILKRDNVVPIYKRKGTKNSVDCYRGISLQPVIAKVFEGFINRALREHVTPLIYENQHGFLKNKSCASNLACYSDFISKTFDKKIQTHSIYTDFQRAFDVVPHELLLLKMNRRFGIEGNVLRWFNSYLYNRKQRVVINGSHSDWYTATSGVPQGSIIGPTLFIMYINDIVDCVHNAEILLFADDCKIYKDVSSIIDCDLLQHDLNRINEWCQKWHMKLHPDKCYFMNFSLKRTHDVTSNYYIGDIPQKRVFEMKDLGVYFTPNLNFNLHISKITSKSLQMLGFIKRITRDFTDIKTLHVLYNSLVRSRLEYCSQIWNPSAAASIIKLERVQKKYINHVSYKSKLNYNRQNYESLCEHFKLKTLQSRRNISDLCFLNKLFHNKVNSPYLTGEVYLRVPRRVLRNKPTFYVNCRIQKRNDSFMPRVLTLANNLDLYNAIVMSKPNEFKRTVSNIFI